MKRKTIYTLNVGDQDYEDMQGNLIFIKLCVESKTSCFQTVSTYFFVYKFSLFLNSEIAA